MKLVDKKLLESGEQSQSFLNTFETTTLIVYLAMQFYHKVHFLIRDRNSFIITCTLLLFQKFFCPNVGECVGMFDQLLIGNSPLGYI